MSQLFYLDAFFSSKLLAQNFFHLLVNVVSGLCIIDDLLLLHLELLTSQSVDKLALLCSLYHLPFELDLLF